MNKLKPCPFCGCEDIKYFAHYVGKGRFNVDVYSHHIQCQGQHCYAIQQGSTEERVTDRWNRRV